MSISLMIASVHKQSTLKVSNKKHLVPRFYGEMVPSLCFAWFVNFGIGPAIY